MPGDVPLFGTYRVEASAKERHGSLLDLGNGGATIAIAISELERIGGARVAGSTTSDSFPETLIQLPGTARGANGVVHMNGDHGVIDYVVDGVPLPQALNREVGSESIRTTLGYHAPLGTGGGIDVAVRNQHTDRELDPPTSIHLIIAAATRISFCASRSRPDATISRTSRSCTAFERSKFRTTSNSANRPRPTTTKRKTMRF